MRVVNTSGITYGFIYKGRTIIIPFDSREYTLPDDVDTKQFGNNLTITVPPRPIIIQPVIKSETSNTSVVKIDLGDITVFDTIKVSPSENKSFTSANGSLTNATTFVNPESVTPTIVTPVTPKPKTTKPKTKAVKKIPKKIETKQTF